jgi:hypothetical protein
MAVYCVVYNASTRIPVSSSPRVMYRTIGTPEDAEKSRLSPWVARGGYAMKTVRLLRVYAPLQHCKGEFCSHIGEQKAGDP